MDNILRFQVKYCRFSLWKHQLICIFFSIFILKIPLKLLSRYIYLYPFCILKSFRSWRLLKSNPSSQIGRASCRERVENASCDVQLMNKTSRLNDRKQAYVEELFFSSRRRHTISKRDWSSDVCSSDLPLEAPAYLYLLLHFHTQNPIETAFPLHLPLPLLHLEKLPFLEIAQK